MARFGFMIGTSGTSGMVNVESLPTPCMVGVWQYKKAQSSEVRGDWATQLYGPAEVIWGMSVINDEARDQWRIICPGPSALVYIKTRVHDDRDYHTFRARVYWPIEETHQAGRVLDFELKFLIEAEL